MPLKQIKDKLSECYKKHQPVLLHGDDPIGRLNLILGIHIDNGGITDAVQYIGVKDEPDSKVFLERIENEIEEAERDWFAKHREFFRNHHGSIDSSQDFYRYGGEEIDPTEIINFKENLYCRARGAFESTNKTWMYHDCNSYGDSIHKNLENSGFWYQIKFFNSNIHHPMIGGRYLYDFKGTLFLNNLKCNSSNNRDVEHYCKFGMEIRDKKFSVNWLVVYVHNLGNFPEPFLNQFEQISLDGEKKRKEGVADKLIDNEVQELKIDFARETLEFNSSVKLEPIVFRLFELLIDNKDRLVTTVTIHNHLWPDMQEAGSVNDQQIYQHAGTLRTALEGIGLEGEIIETKKTSKYKEGGYIFHSNMISLG